MPRDPTPQLAADWLTISLRSCGQASRQLRSPLRIRLFAIMRIRGGRVPLTPPAHSLLKARARGLELEQMSVLCPGALGEVSEWSD